MLVQINDLSVIRADRKFVVYGKNEGGRKKTEETKVVALAVQ